MNRLNKNLSLLFCLKSLAGLLAIGIFSIAQVKAAVDDEQAKQVMAKLQENALAMEKSVPSGFNSELWKKHNQLTRSSNLTPIEAIDLIRNKLGNVGITGEPYTLTPASAQGTSGYLAKKLSRSRIDRITQAIKNEAINVKVREKSGSVSQLKGKLLNKTEVHALVGLSMQALSREQQDKQLGREFLNVYRGVLQIDSPEQEFKLVRRQEDNLKRCHLRYSQRYKGLPVWPAELIVHLDPDGDVDLMTGAYISTPKKIVPKPSLTAEQAIDFAIARVPGGEKADISAPTLIVYAPTEKAPRLAWKMELDFSLSSRWLAVVDAHTGFILDAYEQVMDFNVNGSGKDLFGFSRPLKVWQGNNVFYMADTSKAMFDSNSSPLQPNSAKGAIIVLDARNQGSDKKLPDSVFHVTSARANSGWLPDAVSASYGLSETYDYFLERHNRNSLDGEGGNIIGIVRVREGYGNAFWNGRHMLFGDLYPLAQAIDVIAHELTHGVTQASGGLVYQNQSGALNEAFSDIFGEMAEARTKGAAPDWLKGGTVFATPAQNYRQPSLVSCLPNIPCPAKMSEYIDTSIDNGGVHINSSIINHAFYLLAEGLSGAVGLRDAEKIFYRTLTTKLVSKSQFVDARRGAVVSAEELFGINSIQAIKTIEAFDRVEIFDNVSTPTPIGRSAIASADSTLNLFYKLDIFDDGSGYFIGRHEKAFNDSQQSKALFPIKTKQRLLSVSGDGSEVAFVSADNDFCIYRTDNSQVGSCLGLSGLVYSGTMSSDAQRYAFILLDENGERDNEIILIDLNAPTQTIELQAPLLDGGTIDIIRADVMDFSSNGTQLIYDAFNKIQFEDGSQIGLWSIYGLDIKTGSISVIIPPELGVDSGNPSFSQTRDQIITFEAVPEDAFGSIIFASNLFSGELDKVKIVNGSPHQVQPTFTGDDSAIIYSVPDPSRLPTLTGFSLFHQPLADNLISPQGRASLWLSNASLGIIYRRGDFNQQENFSLNISLIGSGSGLVSSSPAGIICGSDCAEDYLKGTQVSLVANPTSEDAVFIGWSGACSGTGACKVTINANKLVTAKFSLKATLPASNDIFGNARLFAEQQYRDFLHREGDAGGIEYWQKEIESGRLSRAEVANNFLGSNEFAGRIAPIVRLYFAYFRRVPDFQGLNYWLDKFQNGMTLSSISESFEQSNEFKATYGQLSNSRFVTLVYQNVLQRDPDTDGFNHWMAELANGKSRGGIMAGFSESAEYRSKTSSWVGVTMVYAGMLQRSPDSGGFNHWVDRHANSGSLVEIINGFLDSLEYHNRF